MDENRENRDLLIEALVTLRGQSLSLSTIEKKLDTIDEQCNKNEMEIAKVKSHADAEIAQDRSGIRDLNTRWQIMVGIVAFIIVSLISVVGIVVVYWK